MLKDNIKTNENIRPNSKEVERLKTHFPHFFNKDGEFLQDRFEKMLNQSNITLNKEGYELNFLGKSYARYLSSTKTETFITPYTEENGKEENKNSENLYIVGDNLDALKHLLGSYAGKIKCIYIDPPYNTGSDGFVYPDNFSFNVSELAETIGIEEEEAERIINLKGKSSHSAWLTFMYPRLILARELISEEGFVFMSIDENEQANLKMICDEVFGEENYIGFISVENNPKGRKNSDYISVSSEFCYAYAKNKGKNYFVENIPKNANDMILDEDGVYVHNSGKRVLVGENKFNNRVTNIASEKNYSVYFRRDDYSISIKKEEIGLTDSELIKKGYKKYYSHLNGYLVENTYTKDKFLELFKQKALDFADEKIYEKNFNDTIRIKSILKNGKYEAIVKGEKKSYSIELTTTGAGTILKDLFETNELYFDAPKNVGFLTILLTLFKDDNSIILDFFSGSATTAHAVMKLNAEDGGNRKYIMVQLPEKIDKGKPAYKAGYRTIDEIGRERIKRAAKKIKEETGADIDYGFKTYFLEKLEDDVLTNLEFFDDNPKFSYEDMVGIFDTKKAKGKEAILATYLTLDGYGLSAKTEEYKLADFKADKIESSLYIIEQGLTSKDVMELIRRIENLELDIKRIVTYASSISFNVNHELRKNLSNLRNNKTLELIERY